MVEFAKPDMAISRFFTETLGANLKNSRWSWGAYDPSTNRVFLRVWRDEFDPDNAWVQVLHPDSAAKRLGYAERVSHLERIKRGATGFGVVCDAADEEAATRSIMSFDQENLVRLGELTISDDITFAHLDGYFPVASISHPPNAFTTLSSDLSHLLSKKPESTEKQRLVDARVGQGAFRDQVLARWNRRCAVTGTEILDAVRASHIKPWRVSTDAERLDPENGIPLIANLDALFDAGLITFEDSGKLTTSTRLSEAERQIFGLDLIALSREPGEYTKRYLAYHRENILRR